jgi:hypothetical protein
MTHYRILYWKTFPVQVKAWQGDEKTVAMLPDRFERAANVAAMVAGSTDSDAYLAGWQWGELQKRPGDVADVLEQVISELDQAYPWTKLQQMVRSYRAPKDEET